MNKAIYLIFLVGCGAKHYKKFNHILDIPKTISVKQCIELSHELLCRTTVLVKYQELKKPIDLNICTMHSFNDSRNRVVIDCKVYEKIKKDGVRE